MLSAGMSDGGANARRPLPRAAFPAARRWSRPALKRSGTRGSDRRTSNRDGLPSDARGPTRAEATARLGSAREHHPARVAGAGTTPSPAWTMPAGRRAVDRTQGMLARERLRRVIVMLRGAPMMSTAIRSSGHRVKNCDLQHLAQCRLDAAPGSMNWP